MVNWTFLIELLTVVVEEEDQDENGKANNEQNCYGTRTIGQVINSLLNDSSKFKSKRFVYWVRHYCIKTWLFFGLNIR